jgi:hypothetical protein
MVKIGFKKEKKTISKMIWTCQNQELGILTFLKPKWLKRNT